MSSPVRKQPKTDAPSHVESPAPPQQISPRSPPLSCDASLAKNAISPLQSPFSDKSQFETQDELLTARQKYIRLRSDYEHNLKLLEERGRELENYDALFLEKNALIRDKDEQLQQYQSQFSSLQNHCESLRRDRSNLDTQVQTLQSEVEAERQNFRESTLATEKKVEELFEEQDKKFEEELHQLKSKHEKDFIEMEKIIKDKELNIEELKNQIETMESSSKKSHNEIKNLNFKIIKLNDDKRRLDNIISNYDRKLEEFTDQHRALEREVKDKTARATDFEAELERSRESWNAMEAQWQNSLSELKRDRDKANEQVAHLGKILKSKEQKFKEELAEALNAQQSKEGHIGQLKVSLAQQMQLNQQNELKYAHEKQLLTQTHKLELENVRTEKSLEVEALRTKYAKAEGARERDFLEKMGRVQKKAQDFEAQSQASDKLVEDLRRRLRNAETSGAKRAQELSDEKAKLKLTIMELEQKSLKIKNDTKIEVVDRDRKIEELKCANSILSADLQKLRQLQSNLCPKTDMESMKRSIEKSNEDLMKFQGLEMRFHTAIRHVEELTVQLNQLSMDHQKRRAKVDELEAEVKGKDHEIEVMRKKKRALKEMVQLLRTELSSLDGNQGSLEKFEEVYEDVLMCCRDLIDEKKWLTEELWTLVNQKAKFFKTKQNRVSASYKPALGWLSVPMSKLHLLRDRVEEIDKSVGTRILLQKINKFHSLDRNDSVLMARRKLSEVRQRMRSRRDTTW